MPDVLWQLQQLPDQLRPRLHRGYRGIAKTRQYDISMKLRKRIEMLFNHSNASSAWGGSDCVSHAVQVTNSSSPPPPRTSADWQRSFLHRSKREKPDQKGTRAQFSAVLSASATRCFSTEWSESRLSLRLRTGRDADQRTDIRPRFATVFVLLHNLRIVLTTGLNVFTRQDRPLQTTIRHQSLSIAMLSASQPIHTGSSLVAWPVARST